MIVDVNRLIIATRMAIPSLFCKSVYLSISSFDTVTMQGIFSFLDTQVALDNYLIARGRVGNVAPSTTFSSAPPLPHCGMLCPATWTSARVASDSFSVCFLSGPWPCTAFSLLFARGRSGSAPRRTPTSGLSSTAIAATTTISAKQSCMPR